MRDSRVRTKNQQKIGVFNIRDRVDCAGTKHCFTTRKLVSAILGT